MTHPTTSASAAASTAPAITPSVTPVAVRGPAMTTTPIPALTEGLNLGDRHSVACFMAADRTILSRPTVATTPEALREHFQTGPLRRVVIEAPNVTATTQPHRTGNVNGAEQHGGPGGRQSVG